MNKNIKELAMEADFMLCEDGNFYSPTDSQYTPSECYLINAEISKFAELIIRKCAAIADVAVDNHCEWIGGNILVYFGIKE